MRQAEKPLKDILLTVIFQAPDRGFLYVLFPAGKSTKKRGRCWSLRARTLGRGRAETVWLQESC